MASEVKRCVWCESEDIYVKYHDKEWGVPLHSDRKLFEFLILEGAQAGLSWITVLKKRKTYREVFDQFDFNKVVTYKEAKIKSLLNNPGIIRNQLKVRGAVKNAKAFIKVREEFGTFNKYIWQFTDGKVIQNSWKSLKEIPAETEVSRLMSRDLKKRGFTFVGPTICYAFMQAIGMVNDHVVDCYRYKELKT
ncbi:MAG: DNA-3-methyladenine glycosylase I [Proteobacteria bacterium]|nr:DNA-3-methyladenine glycosylase I [Pseudomonadota bacterium]NOG61266.1 DNA-3-methyladenine glycosylase I [Pseudomonadota bacterium]